MIWWSWIIIWWQPTLVASGLSAWLLTGWSRLLGRFTSSTFRVLGIQKMSPQTARWDLSTVCSPKELSRAPLKTPCGNIGLKRWRHHSLPPYGPGAMIARIIGSQISSVFIVLQLGGGQIPLFVHRLLLFQPQSQSVPYFQGLKITKPRFMIMTWPPPLPPC